MEFSKLWVLSNFGFGMVLPISEKPVLVLIRSVETPTRQIFAGRAKSFWAEWRETQFSELSMTNRANCNLPLIWRVRSFVTCECHWPHGSKIPLIYFFVLILLKNNTLELILISTLKFILTCKTWRFCRYYYIVSVLFLCTTKWK